MRTMIVGVVTGMWKTSWHIFRNRMTINVGWKRKTTDWYQWCPVPPKFWPSALLAFAWRCISGDVTIWGIRGQEPRCFVCCVLHFVISLETMYVEVKGGCHWTASPACTRWFGQTDWRMAQDSKPTALRNPNWRAYFLVSTLVGRTVISVPVYRTRRKVLM